MTSSEAFVETLLANKVDVMFGIVGSAFMDALDLFGPAKIRFLSVQHEQNAAHMADGYALRRNSCSSSLPFGQQDSTIGFGFHFSGSSLCVYSSVACFSSCMWFCVVHLFTPTLVSGTPE